MLYYVQTVGQTRPYKYLNRFCVDAPSLETNLEENSRLLVPQRGATRRLAAFGKSAAQILSESATVLEI